MEHCWGHPSKLSQVLFKKKQSISKYSFFLFLATSMNWFSWKPEIHNSIKAEIVPSVAFLNSPARLTMEFPSDFSHGIHNKYSHKRFFLLIPLAEHTRVFKQKALEEWHDSPLKMVQCRRLSLQFIQRLWTSPNQNRLIHLQNIYLWISYTYFAMKSWLPFSPWDLLTGI